jgi:hypothetical protein
MLFPTNGSGTNMKVIILSDELWALAKSKIEQELDCASANASLVRGWNRRHAREKTRLWSEKWVRKRHWEAIRLAKILKQ